MIRIVIGTIILGLIHGKHREKKKKREFEINLAR